MQRRALPAPSPSTRATRHAAWYGLGQQGSPGDSREVIVKKKLTRMALLLLATAPLATAALDSAGAPADGGPLRAQVTEAESPLPVKDSMLSGRYKLTATAPCQVVRTLVDFVLQKKQADGAVQEVVLEHGDDSKNYDPKLMWEVPFALKAGETRELPFQLGPFAIEAGLKKLGYASAAAAFKAADVKFAVRLTARTQGSADTIATFDVKVVP
jgi:hypothetical protein